MEKQTYWTDRLKAEGRSVVIQRFQKDIYTVGEAMLTAAKERRADQRKRRPKKETA